MIRFFYLTLYAIIKLIAMSHLITKKGIREYAKSIGMKISHDSFQEAENRLKEILSDGAKKARAKKRKTILKRDLEHQKDLFDM